MKKVLIVAYYYPPQADIGAQRPYRIAKYLQKCGWNPVVLTVKTHGKRPKNISVIETDYDDIVTITKLKLGFSAEKGMHEQFNIEKSNVLKHPNWKSRLIKLIRHFIAYPDDQRGWYKHAIKSASDYLSNEKVDVIISTSYPVTAHLVSSKLKREFGIPWIADFRDPWTMNPYVNKNFLLKYFERQLESRTLHNANMIVAVTEFWAEKLRVLHNNKKTFCITNGYDEEDFPQMPLKLTKKFTISYTGILYSGKRDPSMLFSVISQLIKEGRIDKNLIEIRFYGPKEDWLKNEIDKFDLNGVVSLNGSVPRDEALKKQRESHILLLLLWDNKREEGFCPGKIYEYFGAKRPIIAIGGKSSIVIKDMLKATNAGMYADNPNSLRKIILKYYGEFVEYGEIKINNNGMCDNYSYKTIAAQYAQIMNHLIL